MCYCRLDYESVSEVGGKGIIKKGKQIENTEMFGIFWNM